MQMKKLLLLLFAVILLAVPATAAIPITSCMVIDQPGTYVLTRDLQDMDPGPDGICIDVQAAATIDGRRHTLDGIGTGKGISIRGEDVADGSEVRNLVLTDWEDGIDIIVVYGIDIIGCRLQNNDFAIDIADGGITVRDCIIEGSEFGINCGPLSFCNLYDSQIKDNSLGIMMGDLTSGTIANNYFRNEVNLAHWGDPELTALNGLLTRMKNIIGGKWSGGNYWASSDNDGYSQTCVDADRNGICDQAYDLGDGYIDNFPLTGRVKRKIAI
jgi:hypothetical protein